METRTFAVLTFAALLLVPTSAQESAPASRPDRWKFREVDDRAPSTKTVVARASAADDTISVFEDGVVVYDVGKTWVSCTTRPKDFRERWVAALPAAALARVRQSASSASAGGRDLDMIDLLDLTRVPRSVRAKVLGAMNQPIPFWPERHQEWDGSWSPATFNDHCEGTDDRLCSGPGRESFRLSATALLSIGYSNLGFPFRPESDRNSGAQRVLRFLLANQKPGGGFSDASDPFPAMTDACASIALSRGTAVARRMEFLDSRAVMDGAHPILNPSRLVTGAHNAVNHVCGTQNPDGSWGEHLDDRHALSVAAWSLLAVRAGQQAAVGSDTSVDARGVAWIEKTVEDLEKRTATRADDLARARAIRALARAGTGADPTADVAALVGLFNKSGTTPLDSETLLFGTLAAFYIGGGSWESWTEIIRASVLATKHTDCGGESWTVPCIWSDAGGRLVSTALMTWVFQVWGRYPLAFTLRP